VTHLSFADWIVVGEFGVALFGLVYFCVRYAISTGGDWRRTAEGRHLMLFRGSLALFMLMGVANNVWPAYPGRDAIRVLIIGVFALAVVHGDALLERAQAARRRLLRFRRDAERDQERVL
jgi:hypothetical protein